MLETGSTVKYECYHSSCPVGKLFTVSMNDAWLRVAELTITNLYTKYTVQYRLTGK